MSEPNEYEALVPADKMPPCPICGKPIREAPNTREEMLMVFRAHGMVALGHDECKPR